LVNDDSGRASRYSSTGDSGGSRMSLVPSAVAVDTANIFEYWQHSAAIELSSAHGATAFIARNAAGTGVAHVREVAGARKTKHCLTSSCRACVLPPQCTVLYGRSRGTAAVAHFLPDRTVDCNVSSPPDGTNSVEAGYSRVLECTSKRRPPLACSPSMDPPRHQQGAV
jgi:uncharacterized protein YfiM (DUF2279 family)